MFTRCSGAPEAFQDYKLILPCIAVGNVGQLTSDLLINSLKLQRAGHLHHHALLPLIGNDAFDHTSPAGYLHTSAEVYCSAQLKTAVVQIRAPIAKGLRSSFCSDLLSWIKACDFSEVIVLTSSHAHERRDAQLTGPPFRFLLSPQCSDLYSHFTEELQWLALEPRRDDSASSSDGVASGGLHGVLTDSELFLPGSGLAKRLLTDGSAGDMRMVVLVAFCSQGDNIPDAIELASRLDQWLKLLKGSQIPDKKSWLCPQSWGLMYGGPSPETLF